MKQTIRFAWLLFAVLLLLAVLVPFAAFADETYQITVKVLLTDNGASANYENATTDNGSFVQVTGATLTNLDTPYLYLYDPSSADSLKVTAKEQTGYSLYCWKIESSGEEASFSTPNPNSMTYTIDDIQKDTVITVVFEANKYSITYKNEEGFNGADLSWTENPPSNHVYGSPTTPVQPKKIKTHDFDYWQVYTKDGTTLTPVRQCYVGEESGVLGADEFTSEIVLEAHWTPKSFTVTRHDGYLDEGEDFHELGTVIGSAQYGSTVSGAEGTDPYYHGYVFDNTKPGNYTVLASVSHLESNNNVYRYYTLHDCTYTVSYQNCGDVLNDWESSQAPLTHTYGTDTVIPNPSRTGYTFAGWEINRSDGDWYPDEIYDGENGTWILLGTAFDSTDETATITLTARWIANTYTLTLDGHNERGELTDRGTESVTVTFDAPLPPFNPPVCAGWDFLGYYLGDDLYYNADGTPAVAAWVHDEDKTLTARWRIRVGEWIEKLYLDFAEYGNGENVKKLLFDAEKDAKAKALDLSSAYLEQLDAIYHEVEQNIGFAKKRDDAIAQLRAYCARLVATQAYNADGNTELQRLLNEAVEAINSSDTISEVEINRLSASAQADMDAVRITKLWVVTETCDIHMESSNGLPKGTTLSANRADVSPIRSQLRAATKRGTVLVQAGNMEIKDVRRILSSMDAVAYYQLSLSAQPESGDTLNFKLLIPENLRSETGFLVAYYENDSETLTVLSTRREGNELLFSAPKTGNVVVFVDHVTNTTPVLAVLICILLLQIAVIAVLLVGKYRSRANAVALPLFAVLAMRVSPSGSLPAVVILLILVIAAQAVLTYLLLSVLGVRFKCRKKKVPAAEAEPIVTESEAPIAPEETPDWVDEPSPPLTVLPESKAPEADNDSDWTDVQITNTPRQSEPEERDRDIPASTDMFGDSIWNDESKKADSKPETVADDAEADEKKEKPDASNPFSEQAKELFGEAPTVKQAPTFTFDDDKS